jgi:hypothetical protein
MNSRNETRKVTPEQENGAAQDQAQTTQEHAWWESVKYPEQPRESER